MGKYECDSLANRKARIRCRICGESRVIPLDIAYKIYSGSQCSQGHTGTIEIVEYLPAPNQTVDKPMEQKPE
jgi:hypothetical protein